MATNNWPSPNFASITISGITNPVAVTQSGTWNITNISGTISLPTGASTSLKQSDGSQKTQVVDGSGNVIASTSNALNAYLTNSSLAITSNQLPASLGAKTIANSMAVNIASDQIVPSNLYVGGAIVTTANPVPIQPPASGALPVSQSGNWDIRNISGTVSLPTNAATSVKQSDGSQKTQIVDGSGNVIASTSNALNINITNSSLAVTQSGNWDIRNISGTVSLPTGASTSSLQTTGNTSLNSIDTKTPALGQALMASSVPVTIASNQSSFPVTVGTAGTFDIFGAFVHTRRQAQVTAQFLSGTTLSNLVTTTLSGGGTATITSNSVLQLVSTTAVTAQAKAVTLNTVSYTSGSEIFAEFTVAFTTPTSAASYQKIGLYSATNGFYVGYNGTTFAIATRNNSVDTYVNKGSWNVDNLTGAAGSLFTSGGSPVAIDFTKLNFFRIRFGWLGIATVVFEVLSPDGTFVIFHKILYPNTALVPHILAPNQPITADVSKTSADATSLTMTTVCWVGGSASGNDFGFFSTNAPVYNAYATTAITTGAYVQLVAATTVQSNEIEIFDSSGQALYLAFGAASAEINQMIIYPGGNGRVRLAVPAGVRVSAKAITGTASSGFLTISFYG
jgi:hypothetical protein